MQRPIITRLVLPLGALSLVVLACSSVACSSGPPPKMTANKGDDGVPANSASEERLAEGGKPKTTAAHAEDPTQPYTTPMNGDGAGAGSAGAGSAGGAGAGSAGAGAGKKGTGKNGKPTAEPPGKVAGKVSKAECKALFDKYIDLTFATDSRFEGIPPEMMAGLKAQALSQAQSQKSDPCATEEVKREQYNCAIVATTTAGWQRCMK